MKSLFAITTILFVSISALSAGENKSGQAAKAGESTCASACASAKAKECPKAAAALRTTLLTHKGSLLVQR